MNFKIDFDQLPDYLYIQTAGEASTSGFAKLLKEIVESPNWKTGTKQIIDHRELVLKKLTSDDMQKIMNLVKRNSKKLGNGRCAFVVKDNLGFGMSRMYELLGGEDIHSDVRVFYSVNEAVEWLNQ